MNLPGTCSCDGWGYYWDPQCRADECAHAHYRVYSVTTTVDTQYGPKVVEKMKDTGRVMDCPLRICICKAGRKFRAFT